MYRDKISCIILRVLFFSNCWGYISSSETCFFMNSVSSSSFLIATYKPSCCVYLLHNILYVAVTIVWAIFPMDEPCPLPESFLCYKQRHSDHPCAYPLGHSSICRGWFKVRELASDVSVRNHSDSIVKERDLGWNQLGGYRNSPRDKEMNLREWIWTDAVGLERERTCERGVEWLGCPQTNYRAWKLKQSFFLLIDEVSKKIGLIWVKQC